MKIEEKLTVNFYRQGEESHITVDQEQCRKCSPRYCVSLCPAHLYTWNEDSQEMLIEFSGCLECGTCYVICDKGAIDWNYPRGGYGVCFRLT